MCACAHMPQGYGQGNIACIFPLSSLSLLQMQKKKEEKLLHATNTHIQRNTPIHTCRQSKSEGSHRVHKLVNNKSATLDPVALSAGLSAT